MNPDRIELIREGQTEKGYYCVLRAYHCKRGKKMKAIDIIAEGQTFETAYNKGLAMVDEAIDQINLKDFSVEKLDQLAAKLNQISDPVELEYFYKYYISSYESPEVNKLFRQRKIQINEQRSVKPGDQTYAE